MNARPPTQPLVQVSWFICLGFLLLLAEVMLGDRGLLFPGAAILAFYLTVSYDWRVGGTMGLLAVVVHEITMGRRATMIPLIILVVIGGYAWKKSGDQSTLLNQIFPGALMGATYALLVLYFENSGNGELIIAWSRLLIGTLISGMITMVTFPLFIYLADRIARLLEIRQYHRRAPVRGEMV